MMNILPRVWDGERYWFPFFSELGITYEAKDLEFTKDNIKTLNWAFDWNFGKDDLEFSKIIERPTGLKDINRHLIFEGDIVCTIEYGDYEYNKAKERKQIVEIIKGLKVPEYNEPPFINKNHAQVIVWDNKRATFAMRDRINSSGRPESLFCKKYLIIGNIHENGDLLK